MDISEVADLFDGCSTYETQYLPTFRKVLNHLGSANVIDIATRFEEYKDTLLGPACRKHVKSLIDKLAKNGKIPLKTVVIEVPTMVSIVESSDDESDGDGEKAEAVDNSDLAKQIKYLSIKAQVLQEFFNMTVPHLHLLPPDVLADLVRKNLWGRIPKLDDI